MAKVTIPPIKCQGIKSKLVPWIKQSVLWQGEGRWIETFMGSGVVGLNMRPGRGLFADNNPHIIRFYQEITTGVITAGKVRSFLKKEGELLAKQGKTYYYEVRERFNESQAPLDFLFLNRACFNGLMRFNQQGKFNVPFNHKPERFSQAYITKICNQIQWVSELCQLSDYTFVCRDFRDTLAGVEEGDFVYCDPPYAGRHTDYFNTWDERDEVDLAEQLGALPAPFMLSTWHSNHYRSNPQLTELWSEFHVTTRQHFYHVGAKEKNRQPILEALVTNYALEQTVPRQTKVAHQLALLETPTEYT